MKLFMKQSNLRRKFACLLAVLLTIGSIPMDWVTTTAWAAVKTYIFDGSAEINAKGVAKNKNLPTDQTYGTDGYFTVEGSVAAKNGGKVPDIAAGKGSVNFHVTGSADVEVAWSSTKDANTSYLSIIDGTGSTVNDTQGNAVASAASKKQTTTQYKNLAEGDYKVTCPEGINDAWVYTIKVNQTDDASSEQPKTEEESKTEEGSKAGEEETTVPKAEETTAAPTAPTQETTRETKPQSENTTVIAKKADSIAASVQGDVQLIKSNGYLESAYAEWLPVEKADSYKVFVKKVTDADSAYTQVDSELIRKYSDDGIFYRVDAVGLAAGEYVLKIVAVAAGEEIGAATVTETLTVTNYDRTGFAWVNGESNGAYNANGTLKNNAVVLYITENTKDSIHMDVVTSNKGATTSCTGITEILNAYKKGYDLRPLAIRIIGKVTNDGKIDADKEAHGDIVFSGSSATKRLSCGVTIEGIGEDATAYGWGVRIKNSSNVEVRNIGFMMCDSEEGDDVGLQQDNDHIWVHNCDMFYGNAGGDADQAKGDGALDCKKSTYVTFSYNHFWDNGKCNLLGLSEGTTEGLYITYHHNWYDHSDSRHPRVRYYSAHVYNNYYDGNAKYGIGSTLGSSVFADRNYFRNCQYPILTSMQGSDVFAGATVRDYENSATFSKEAGGTVKAYGNVMVGNYTFIPYGAENYIKKGEVTPYDLTGTDATKDFDAVVVDQPQAQVANTITSITGFPFKKGSGGSTYNNFDTSSVMYDYTADTPEVAKENVMQYAGRVNGGDFKWTFTEDDDTSYAVNAPLKAALQKYEAKVVLEAGKTAPQEPVTQAPTQSQETTTAKTEETSASKTEQQTQTTAPTTQPTKAEETTKTTQPAGEVVYTENGYDARSTQFTGAITSLSTVTDDQFASVVYVSVDGKADADGSKENPVDLETAIANAKDGVAIILLEGTYAFDHQVTLELGNNGSADAYKVLKAADGANVTLDFSSQEYGDTATNPRGLQMDADYWYVKGIRVYGASDNGIFVSGNHNVVENCVLDANRDTGLQISRRNSTLADKKDWPSYNYIINCTSVDNRDPKTGENADGFAAKLTCGEGNVFDGCIAYCNCDDGWDLYAKPATGSIGSVTIRNCVAFGNGTLTDGSAEANGDMNGFKLGGSKNQVPTPHWVFNCVAFDNGHDGFTDNGNGGALTLINCTSRNNAKSNFNFYRTVAGGTFKNLISTSGKGTDKFIGTLNNSITFNSSKYYQVAQSENGVSVISGQKIGDVVKDPASTGAFESTTALKISKELYKELRNADGTVTLNGYLITTGNYASMGAHFNQSTQVVAVKASLKNTQEEKTVVEEPTEPATEPTQPEVKPTEPTVEPTKPTKPVEKLAISTKVSSSKVVSGNKVTVTASATGGKGSYTYRYIMYNPTTKAWTQLQGFTDKNTFTWTTTGTGARHLYAEVKDGNGTVSRSAAFGVTLTTRPTVSAKISTSKVATGNKVTMTATASEGSGNYTYRYIMYTPATKAWTQLQPFGAKNTYTWTATGTGARHLYVEVKDSNGTVTRSQAYGVTVTTRPEVTGRLSTSKVATGNKVTIKATASQGSGKYTYRYIMYTPATKAWVELQGYSAKDSYTWTATGTGARHLYVEVKDGNGTVTRSIAYGVTVVSKPVVSAKLSTSKVAPGKTVTMTATASQGSGQYAYRYVMYNTVTKAWSQLRDYNASNTYTWRATGTGARHFYVDVKDSNGTIVRSQAYGVTIAK